MAESPDSDNEDSASVENNPDCDCLVCDLLKKSFYSRSYDEQLVVILKGRPVPAITLTQPQKGQQYTRNFVAGSFYDKYEWLTGCPQRKKMFCFSCILFGENERGQISSNGVNNLKNIHRIMKKHANSIAHLRCIFQQKTFIVRCDEPQSLQQNANNRHNQRVHDNREIFKRLIDIACFLEGQERRCKGKNANKDLVAIMAKYDSFLNSHLELSSVIRQNLDSIHEDLIKAITKAVLDRLKKDVDQIPYICLALNEVLDAASRSRISMVLRYVQTDGGIQEKFIGFLNNTERNPKEVCSELHKNLENFQGERKLIALTCDGLELHLGLQENLKFPIARFVHSSEHSMCSVILQSLTHIEECRMFLFVLNKLAESLLKAANDHPLPLDEHAQMELTEAAETSHNDKLIMLVHKHRESLISAFGFVVESNKWNREIAGLSKTYMDVLNNDLNFNFILVVLKKIFESANVCETLKIANYRKYCKKIKAFADKISKSMGLFTQLWEETLEIGNFQPQSKRIKIENDSESSNINGANQRRIFDKIMNTISAILVCRQRWLQDMKFLELCHFQESESFPPEALDCLMKHPAGGHFEKPVLTSQLTVLHIIPEVYKLKSCAKVYRYLKQNKLDEAFCDVCNLCCFVLTNPVGGIPVNKNGDGNVWQRIKSFARNCEDEDELFNLRALLVIEKDYIKSLTEDTKFYDDVIDEFAKLDDRFDLHFK